MGIQPRDWLEQQLPGLEDSPLWVDRALVVSVPLEVRQGLTNVVTIRRLDHINYLDFHRRTCTLDRNTGLALATLPQALDEQIEAYKREVFGDIHPFI